MEERVPLISVVIPVLNGEKWLHSTLLSVFSQNIASEIEVIIIDSGSSDNSLAIVKQFPVRILTIPPDQFNHGETRNLGVRQAQGTYVVMTVQDAKASGKEWLAELLKGFTDAQVAGVCGQQIVSHHTDKNPIDWSRPVSLPVMRRLMYAKPQEFEDLSADEKRRICSWDDVNAMYRRDVLLKIPFQKVLFAEDALWARDALKAGYAIVYQPTARVEHYHLELPDFTFRRSFTQAYHFYLFFNTKPKFVQNGPVQALKNIKVLGRTPNIPISDKIRWLLLSIRQRKAINLAVHLFNTSLEKGIHELHRKHQEVCGTPPQVNDDKIE